MAGIGLGHALAYSLVGAFLFWYLRRPGGAVQLVWGNQPFRMHLFWDILKVGLVACAGSLLTVLTVIVVAKIVAQSGTQALAGFCISTRLEFMLIPVAFAIGSACNPLVGMAIGSGNVRRAREVAWTGGGLAAVLVGAIGILFAFEPSLWVRFYTDDQAVAEVASTYLVWAGPCYVMFGGGICLYFAAMGSGKLLAPMLASSIRLITVAIGGWWIGEIANPPYWVIFAVISASMCFYGVAIALAIWFSDWSSKLPAR